MNDSLNRVLMIAVEYPPCKSAGVQRTLKFSEQLPALDWSPVVLSVSTRAYTSIDEESGTPEGVVVERAFGLDSLKQLRVKGKYLGFTVHPDRYMTWMVPAIIKGLYMVRKYRPKVIYSTFPYPSAHAIAWIIAKLTKLPWVADYRDPSHHHYLPASYSNKVANWLDSKTVENADHLLFATDGMRQLYLSKYSRLKEQSTSTIENGYNEELFGSLEITKRNDGRFVILHSGALITGRDPAILIEALGSLIAAEPDSNLSKVELHFRAASPSAKCTELIETYQLQDKVKFLPSVSYKESIKEMLSADALLLMQGDAFNYQIPGKAYEYIATKKPILALTDRKGATGQLLSSVEGSYVMQLGELEQAKKGLKEIQTYKEGEREIDSYGRKARTKKLAEILDFLRIKK